MTSTSCEPSSRKPRQKIPDQGTERHTDVAGPNDSARQRRPADRNHHSIRLRDPASASGCVARAPPGRSSELRAVLAPECQRRGLTLRAAIADGPQAPQARAPSRAASRARPQGPRASYSLKQVRAAERDLAAQGETAYRTMVAAWQPARPQPTTATGQPPATGRYSMSPYHLPRTRHAASS
jgi:hypothetical protein